jgi:hypothetical protein
MGENEKFIHFIGSRAHTMGREHWSVRASATFTINQSLTSEELSARCLKAWCALRFAHPSIACTAEGDTLSYVVPSSESIADWANETFTVHEPGASAEDVMTNLGPSKYITCHLFPDQSMCFLQIAHWRTDGYGALQLVNAFLDNLCKEVGGEDEELRWGDEAQRLTPSIEEVLRLPVKATQEIMDATKDCMKTLGLAKGAVGVALEGDGSAGPAGTRRVRFRLAAADTIAVVAACAAHNISITSAVHASCASLTYLEASQDDRDKHYTSTMRFSLRPHLPDPYCTTDYAAAIYTGGYMSRVPASQSWLENAKHYEKEYTTGVSNDFLRCRRQYAIEVLAILQKGPPAPNPPPSEVDISSVGDAEALVSLRHANGETVLEVQDVSIGVETLTRQMYCFVWTFRGHLELQLVYNESYYEAERVEKMVRSLADILKTGLDLTCGS